MRERERDSEVEVVEKRKEKNEKKKDSEHSRRHLPLFGRDPGDDELGPQGRLEGAPGQREGEARRRGREEERRLRLLYFNLFLVSSVSERDVRPQKSPRRHRAPCCVGDLGGAAVGSRQRFSKVECSCRRRSTSQGAAGAAPCAGPRGRPARRCREHGWIVLRVEKKEMERCFRAKRANNHSVASSASSILFPIGFPPPPIPSSTFHFF